MGVFEGVSRILIEYLPIVVPSVGLKAFVSPIYEDVGSWIISLWIVFPILALVQTIGSFSFLSLVGYVILAKAVYTAVSKRKSPSFSYVTLLVGVGASAAYLYVKGFDLTGSMYPYDVLGASLVVSFTPSTGGTSELLLALSFAAAVLPDGMDTIVYPIVILSAVAISMKNFFMWILEEDKMTFAKRVRIITMSMTVVMVSLIFMVVVSDMASQTERIIKRDLKEHLEFFSHAVQRMASGKNIKQLLEDGDFLALVSGDLKPSFVKNVYVVSRRRRVIFGKPPSRERPGKYRTLTLKEDGYEIIIVYENVIRDFQDLFTARLFLILGLAAGSLAFGFWINNVIWVSTMEKEVVAKTESLNAANEELSAMNEELIRVNEELSGVYGDLTKLNRGILNFLNFVKSIDIKDDSEKIFREMFKVISGTLGRRPIGYEIVDRDGKMIYGYGDWSDFHVDLNAGKFTMKVYYSEKVELSEDELIFIDIVSSIGAIMVYAHENYVSMERSNLFLSKVLGLLDTVLLSNSKEEIEEIILRQIFDLFDDACTVAIGWIDDFEDNVLTVKYLNSKNDSVNIRRLVERGIMKYVLTRGEEYIVRDVSKDHIYVKSNETSKSAVALPLKTEKGIVGVMEIDRSTPDAFTEDDLRVLRIFVRIVSIVVQRMKYYKDLKNTLLDTIEALSYAIELKDPYTNGHSRRVANYAMAIARAMGMPRDRIETIEIAALLHDIGKIGIRGSVLNKPSRLTKDEYEEIMKHPVLGEELVKRIRNFRHIAKIIRHHHEFYGGGGYPDGLKGEEIPLESRIIAVADAFDAMTSDRPYRKALSVERALEILERDDRNQWDPKIVKVAIRVFRELFSEDFKDEDSAPEK